MDISNKTFLWRNRMCHYSNRSKVHLQKDNVTCLKCGFSFLYLQKDATFVGHSYNRDVFLLDYPIRCSSCGNIIEYFIKNCDNSKRDYYSGENFDSPIIQIAENVCE
jgi:hypothetical protein